MWASGPHRLRVAAEGAAERWVVGELAEGALNASCSEESCLAAPVTARAPLWCNEVGSFPRVRFVV